MKNSQTCKCLGRFLRNIFIMTVLLLCMGATAFALDGKVATEALRVRSLTTTESESVGTVHLDETLNITGRIGDWYIIDFKNGSKYVYTEYVTIPDDIEIMVTMGEVTGDGVNMRAGTSTETPRVCKLAEETQVIVTSVCDGWYGVRYLEYVGYISADYVSIGDIRYRKVEYTAEDLDPEYTSDLPDAGRSVYKIPDTSPVSECSAETEISGEASELSKEIIKYAMKFLGTPYAYGGASPSGFDCSGFTKYVFSYFGYELNRSSSAQIKNGVSTSKSELKPGDLVFFSRPGYSVGHVGIYIGDGEFIHSTKPGDVVKITSMSESYYTKRYVGARRII